MQRGLVNPGRSGTLLAVDQGKLPKLHNKILTYTPRSGKEGRSVIDVTEYARPKEGLRSNII